MIQPTRSPNLKFARPTPMWRLLLIPQSNKITQLNSPASTLVLPFDIVELGSGDQISHLASAGLGIIERTAQENLLISRSFPLAKSEV
jgi:hypothetical protein